MATLTYDPTPADQPEFSEAEQEAIQVGEEAIAEQNRMLAGKFEDAEALEKAYLELQSKLGEPKDEPVEEQGVRNEEETPEEEVTQNFLDKLWDEAQSEVSPETLEALKGMSPEELAQMHLEYRNQVENNQQEQPDMSPQAIEALQGIVGGEQEYTQMIQWAGSALDPKEIEMFDSVMDSGNPNACYYAIQSLASRYYDAVGQDGKVLTGAAPQEVADVYRSQAEVVQAMADPRYDRDPAYRQDVFDKLERSNLNNY